MAVEHHVQAQLKAVASQEAALGDVVGRVAEIRERLHPDNRNWFGSPVPSAPYTMEVVMTFANQMNAWRTQSLGDLEYLQSIDGRTQQVDVRDLLYQVNNDLQSIERFNRIMSDELESLLAGHDQIDTYLDRVPNHRIAQELTKMNNAMELIAVADAFNKSVGHEAVDSSHRMKRYAAASGTLRDRADQAVSDARFPEIRSEDPALLAAAEDVLARDEYKVNPIVRIGITYDIQRKSTAEGSIDWGSVVTTVSVTDYEWDEFAVTTVENVNGNYHLFYNEFKYFHSGGTDVPTGKWTLSKRRQGSRILEQNALL